MKENFIINYAKNISKDDIKNFAIKNNVTINDKDTEIIYNHIKKYYNVFFENPEIYITMLKDKISDNIYEKIIVLYNQYKIYLK